MKPAPKPEGITADARCVRECMEDGVHRNRMLNHVVYSKRHKNNCQPCGLVFFLFLAQLNARFLCWGGLVREFAAALYPQIEEDDATLRSIITSLGGKPSATKQASGWLLEKAFRMKLGHTGSADFSLSESLELLCLASWASFPCGEPLGRSRQNRSCKLGIS